MNILDKEKTRGELATKRRVMSDGRQRIVYCGRASADGEGGAAADGNRWGVRAEW